jgi:hypothetical protein
LIWSNALGLLTSITFALQTASPYCITSSIEAGSDGSSAGFRTTDNSLFSSYGFQQRNPDEIAFYNNPGKPIRIENEYHSNSDDESSPMNGGRVRTMSKNSKGGTNTNITRTANSLIGYSPVPFDMLEMNTEFVTRWFNNTMQSPAMQSFPQDVVMQNGSQIFDLIAFLSGKKAPGQATPKQLTLAAHANAKDALKVILTQYEDLINFLKVNGAHLNTVRPEYLLSLADYFKFTKLFPKDDTLKPKTIERVFPYQQTDAWVTVFY